MRCDKCGGNMTIDRAAQIEVPRTITNCGIVDRFRFTTTIAACDKCEHVIDLGDTIGDRA